MLKQDHRREMRDLIDRSMIILILRCDECDTMVARIIYPLTAKLDKTCSQHDHSKETKHRTYTALKHVVIYMNAADKELADQLGKKFRKKFEDFIEYLKPSFNQKTKPKGWNCPKCGVLPRQMVKVKGNKHYCKICKSEVQWES